MGFERYCEACERIVTPKEHDPDIRDVVPLVLTCGLWVLIRFKRFTYQGNRCPICNCLTVSKGAKLRELHPPAPKKHVSVRALLISAACLGVLVCLVLVLALAGRAP